MSYEPYNCPTMRDNSDKASEDLQEYCFEDYHLRDEAQVDIFHLTM